MERQVKAVRQKPCEPTVYQIPWLPYSWFDRPPGSNRILGTVWLAKTVYPEMFADLDMTEAIQDYFQVFYHLSITDKDVSDLLSMKGQASAERKAKIKVEHAFIQNKA